MKRAMAVPNGVSALTAAAPMAAATEPPHDLCNAAGHQYLIGRPVKELARAPAGEVWRTRSTRAGQTPSAIAPTASLSYGTRATAASWACAAAERRP